MTLGVGADDVYGLAGAAPSITSLLLDVALPTFSP